MTNLASNETNCEIQLKNNLKIWLLIFSQCSVLVNFSKSSATKLKTLVKIRCRLKDKTFSKSTSAEINCKRYTESYVNLFVFSNKKQKRPNTR